MPHQLVDKPNTVQMIQILRVKSRCNESFATSSPAKKEMIHIEK